MITIILVFVAGRKNAAHGGPGTRLSSAGSYVADEAADQGKCRLHFSRAQCGVRIAVPHGPAGNQKHGG